MKHKTAIELNNISKSFQVGTQDIQVLFNTSLEIKKGDFAIIFGPSGCGKSTLLHIILGLEPPSHGKVILLNSDLYTDWEKDDRSNFRKKNIGMVYQQPNWIKSLNVVENIAFPLLLLREKKNVRLDRSMEMLKLINMTNWAQYMPAELSSGQQQKIALARALITNPEIIIADEPTGNLDFDSGQEMMSLLSKLNKETGKTLLMVTHDLIYLDFAQTAIEMKDGQLVQTYTGENKDLLLSNLSTKRIKKKK